MELDGGGGFAAGLRIIERYRAAAAYGLELERIEQMSDPATIRHDTDNRIVGTKNKDLR